MNPWISDIFYGEGITVVGSDNNLYTSLSKNIGIDPTTHPDIWTQESSSLGAGGGSGGNRFYVNPYVTSIGDGTNLTYTVTHNLNSTDVAVTVRDTTVGDIVYPTVDVVDANNISITLGTAPTLNEMRVLVGGY